MSLFGEQLQDRIKRDDRAATGNLKKLANVASGKKAGSFSALKEELRNEGNLRQIERICNYLKIDFPKKVKESDNIDEQIDFFLQPSGASKRRVILEDKWRRNGDGPLLVKYKERDEYLALFPNTFRGYHYVDEETGRNKRVGKERSGEFEQEAYCFYKPLPARSMTGKDFLRFLLGQLSKADVTLIVLSVVFATVFGLITPFAAKYAFSALIPSRNAGLLIPLGFFLASAAVGTWFMNVVKVSINSRINNRLDVICQSSVFSRVMGLPASFFSDKSSGGLAQMIFALGMVPALITEIFFGVGLTVLISVIYIIQLVTFTPSLVGPAFVIYGVEIAVFIITILQERKMMAKMLEGDEKNTALVFALLSGIQKIKVSGSETRAYAKWLDTYRKKAGWSYMVRFPSSLRAPLITAVHMLGMLWMYAVAFPSGVDVSNFTAFFTAFGMVMAGLYALSSSGTSFSLIGSILKMGEPLLKAVPEGGTGKRNISSLSGKIDLDQVTFKYTEDSPNIFEKLTLHIDPGEYVAVVGRSGCGKSTLMRLLLGFEEPQQGTVAFDDLDIGSVDIRSLRRCIGTVLQDGKLFTGDIYSNITISAPWMTMDDAWEAAEKAGIAEDIRRMPMGMHTLITEGGGGISGGQKQRLLIARALCPRPGIIMFDEATSALDNITQRIVTDSLNAMKSTRIVIAHRLSTIKECDRIIVLDQGKIAEDGTYDELLAKGGIFTELARRQLVEEEY